MVLGQISARRGAGGTWLYLDEAAAAADGSGEQQWIVAARVARAEAHWLASDAAAAGAEADRFRGGRRHAPPGIAAPRCPGCAVCGCPRPAHRSPSRTSAARRLPGEGRPALDRFRLPYHAALTLYDTAEERLLRRALELFTGLGATAAVRPTRRKMRDAGIRSIPAGPRFATRADPLGLTRREHEILALVGAGLTSAEIAARLFISAKTVDHHVASAVGKLGAPSRAAAAARLRPVFLARPIRAPRDRKAGYPARKTGQSLPIRAALPCRTFDLESRTGAGSAPPAALRRQST